MQREKTKDKEQRNGNKRRRVATDETDYLNSIPGMLKSIVKARKEPLSDSSQEAGW